MKVIGVIVFVLAVQAIVAQSSIQIPLVIEAQYAIGTVAPVYPQFPKKTFSQAFELHVGYQTTGTRVWHRLFNYPRMGLSFIFQDLGNERVLGHQFSVVPTVYFSTAHREKSKVYAEIRYGLGVAYFSNPYDSLRNPDNKGASSRFTWQFTLGANLRWNIDKRTSLQIGGVWYHASNSHTQLPNVGVNNFALYAGILTYPFGQMPRRHHLDTMKLDHRWHFNIQVGVGMHKRGSAFGPVHGTLYPVYTLSLYTNKRLGKLFQFKFGAIYRYYPMYQSFLADYNIAGGASPLRSSSFIFFVGNEFMLGRIALNIEVGVNIYKPAYETFYNTFEKASKFTYYTKQYIATRFGFNYYLLDPDKHPRNNAFVGAGVSANFGQAEFLEFNLGYRF